MRKFRTAEQWQAIIKDQQQSGMTISAYCRHHKISASGFFTQRKKQVPSVETLPTFISAKVTQETQTAFVRQEQACLVLEIKGATLKLPATTSADYLVTLFNGLQ